MTAPTPSQELNRSISRNPSLERLTMLRNFAYGAAAVCLATLVALTQVGASDPALRTAVFASAIAMPLWLLIGGAIEYYILLGKSSYMHFRKMTCAPFPALVALIATVAFVVVVASVIYFLVPAGAWLFGAVGALSILLYWRFHWSLARHLASRSSPGAPQDGAS